MDYNNNIQQTKWRIKTMVEEEFTPTAPSYAGDGIAMWEAKDRNGNLYYRVSVLKGKPIACFKVKPKTDA